MGLEIRSIPCEKSVRREIEKRNQRRPVLGLTGVYRMPCAVLKEHLIRAIDDPQAATQMIIKTADEGQRYKVYLPTEHAADKLMARSGYAFTVEHGRASFTPVFRKIEVKMQLDEMFKWVQRELRCQEENSPKPAPEVPVSEDETDLDQRGIQPPRTAYFYEQRTKPKDDQYEVREVTVARKPDPKGESDTTRRGTQMPLRAEQERRESSADRNTCRYCRKPGHWARECPNRSRSPSRSRSTERLPDGCWNCGDRGHTLLNCPLSRCSYCLLKGHLMIRCPQKAEPQDKKRVKKRRSEHPSVHFVKNEVIWPKRVFTFPRGTTYRPDERFPRVDSSSRSRDPEGRRSPSAERAPGTPLPETPIGTLGSQGR